LLRSVQKNQFFDLTLKEILIIEHQEIYDLLAGLRERSIPECFAEIVEKTPNALAVSSGGQVFTYASLDQASNQIAHAILQRTTPDDKAVVLLIGRSAFAIVGMLGILKAGKICIPLHPVNNEARILDSVLDDHRSPLILTNGVEAAVGLQAGTSARILDMQTLPAGVPATHPHVQLKPDDCAFIIYTSGSTGLPKGALHTHRNILSRVFWYAHRFKVGERDRTLMLSAADSISGIVGMLRPLVTGGQSFLFSIRREGFDVMARTIKEQEITILPMVNSVFRYFVDSLPSKTQLPSVRLIILGGEIMTTGDVKRYRQYFSETCLLLNTLGCTELPTYRYFVIDKNTNIERGVVPVGYAVPGNDVEIVDSKGHRVAPGKTGEIVVRSQDLALGYWNRPDETSKRFFQDETGTPAYRTGDLGRMGKDGLLEYMGRMDSQVKILGNRIELAEIENALREHPDVLDAAVDTWKNSFESAELYANVVYRDGEKPGISEMKNFLRSWLPDYMVPLEFIAVSALPLTRTGKVNRRALIPPGHGQGSRQSDSSAAPRSELEKGIAEICRHVLNLQAIGVRDNLFDLGANSLVVFKMVNRLRDEFEVDLPLAFIFDFPTVEALAGFIQNAINQDAC